MLDLKAAHPYIETLDNYAKVVCGPFGSAVTEDDYQETGVPFLRISDITKDGTIDESEMLFLSSEKSETLKNTQVFPGDLVISQRGTLGIPGVVPDSYAVWNISANLIAIKNLQDVSAKFAQAYLSCELGAFQILRCQSGQVQSKITTQDVASLLIPKVENEQKLVSELDAARQERAHRLADADALLSSLDSFLLDELGLKMPENKGALTFAIKMPQLQLEGAINPERYAGLFLEKAIHGTFISQVAEIVEEKSAPSNDGPQEVWDWIRIDDLENQPLEVGAIRTLTGSEIEGSFFAVRENDILVARLGPTIQNAKFVLCPALERQTVASSEFLVLRCRNGWNPKVVLWVLRTSFFRRLIYSKGRGGTPSRYRVNREDFAKLPFPNQPNNQTEIAEEIETRLNQVRSLRADADAEWNKAKARFESSLLGE